MVHKYIRSREIYKNFTTNISRKDIEYDICKNNINDMIEKGLDVTKYNKIFASCWYTDDVLFLGSKDNKLIKCDLKNKKSYSYQNIPLLDSGNNISSFNSIYSISINSSRNMLVTGATDSAELSVYSLPHMIPTNILIGHEKYCFTNAFIDDNFVVSGSFNGTICIWKLDNNMDKFILQPILQKQTYCGKIRDLKITGDKNIVTLYKDNNVTIYDTNTFQVIFSILLDKRDKESVCIACDDYKNIIAVGSCSGTNLYDIRSKNKINEITSMHNRIRSLGFMKNIISIGESYGYLSFFDLIKMDYIKINNNNILYRSKNRNHAIFTHSFNPIEKKLFTGGGPIDMDDKGSFASIWEKYI